MALRLPAAVLEKQCAKYTQRGKPIQRAEILSDSDYDIVVHYQSEYRGFVQYYLLAHNVSWLWKLHRVAETSLLKTLANKHKTSVKAMARKYKARTRTAYGSVTCLEVIVPRPDKKPLIARFGGLALRRQHTAILQDEVPRSYGNKRSQLIERLLADKCELCGKHDPLEVHHIRKLADLKQKGRREKPMWEKRMIAMRRKTLVVCDTCHTSIHAGKIQAAFPK